MKKSILEMDFSIADKQMDLWHKERETKGKIYRSFSEFISYLENLLECENDPSLKNLIQKEIKKLKKQQQNYSFPSIMEMQIYSPTYNSDVKEKKESPFSSLIKKIKK